MAGVRERFQICDNITRVDEIFSSVADVLSRMVGIENVRCHKNFVKTHR